MENGRCSVTISVTGTLGESRWCEAAKPINKDNPTGPHQGSVILAECLARTLVGTFPDNALGILEETAMLVREVLHAGKQKKAKAKQKTSDAAEKYHPFFEEWWAAYPVSRKQGKLEASKAWAKAGTRIKAARQCTPMEAVAYLLDRVLLFAKSPKGTGEYCPMPATWLNQGRYDDDPASWGDLAGQRKGPIEATD